MDIESVTHIYRFYSNLIIKKVNSFGISVLAKKVEKEKIGREENHRKMRNNF